MLEEISARARRRLSQVRQRDDESLRARVAVLEDEVQECRALNARIAELTDVVTELLLPVASRDDAALAAALERYRTST